MNFPHNNTNKCYRMTSQEIQPLIKKQAGNQPALASKRLDYRPSKGMKGFLSYLSAVVCLRRIHMQE
jgi:hypothetical protein